MVWNTAGYAETNDAITNSLKIVWNTVGYVKTNYVTTNSLKMAWNTLGYATTNDVTKNECYNEPSLSIKSGCYNEYKFYNERGEIISADVTRACS
jgi:hypothetical protein